MKSDWPDQKNNDMTNRKLVMNQYFEIIYDMVW